jgi:hypothetical protein
MVRPYLSTEFFRILLEKQSNGNEEGPLLTYTMTVSSYEDWE